MKKSNLLREVLIGGVVAIGSAYGTYKALDSYVPSSQPGSPVKVFYTNADGKNYSDVENDDLVLGYENGDIDVYVRDANNRFNKIEELRTEELSRVDSSRKTRLEELSKWYSSQMADIWDNFAGIREKLK